MAALSLNKPCVVRSGHRVPRQSRVARPVLCVARASTETAASSRRDILGAAIVLGAAAVAPALPAMAAASPAAVLQKAYPAFGLFAATGEYGPLEAFWTDDISWEANVNGGFKGKGKADVKRFFDWVADVENFTKFEPVKFIEQGSDAAVVINIEGTGKKTGKPFNSQMTHFFTVNGDGKITSFKEFMDTAKLNAVLGSTPFPK